MIVFQDLTLHPGDDLPRVRTALIASAAAPWRHDQDAEDEMRKLAGRDADTIVFARDAGEDVEAAGLFLRSRSGNYEVTNIVPRETASLGESGYNTVLRDFIARVVEPAAAQADFRIAVTTPEQTVDDWLPDAAASALRRFSATANKATGSAHPSDRERWQAFLIAVHGTETHLTTDLLKRWLAEDGWTEDGALELAIEYEFGLALLNAYDRDRT